MKTKAIGGYCYFVAKYFINENGQLDATYTRWGKAAYAFEDAEAHKAVHGEDMAFVFKAKQCIEVK